MSGVAIRIAAPAIGLSPALADHCALGTVARSAAMSTNAASSSAAAAAIAATSTEAVAASSSSSEPSHTAAAGGQADLSLLRSDLQWMHTHAALLSAAAAAASASPSSGFAALADAFFEIDEFVAARAASANAAGAQQPHTSRSRIQQLQTQTQAKTASTDGAEAQRLELSALLDAWHLHPSSSSVIPAAAPGVLHPSAFASLSRSVRSQLAAHFLERLAVAGSDSALHAELTNIVAQILPPQPQPTPQLDASQSGLSAAQSQLCSSLSRQLHAHILPSISAFEWSRKRDLPPILSKPILRPSAAVLLLQAFLRGVNTDAQANLNPASARVVLLDLLVEVTESCKEIYTSLGATTVSRFHSRQLFVDVASVFVVLRSAERAWQKMTEREDAAAAVSSQDHLSTAQSFCRVHTALLELACALVITHPTLMPLSDFPPLLARWEQSWTQQRASGPSVSASVNAGETVAAVDALLSKQLGMLWGCEAAAFAAAAASSSAAASPPPSFLSSFFSMPRLQLSGSDDAAAASAAGIAPDTHWLSQKLELGSGCVPVEMLSAPIVVASIPPARLIRLVQMRHQLREADFPELDANEEAMAAELRSHCARLAASAVAVQPR